MDLKRNSFQASNQRGQIGECFVAGFLLKRGWNIKFTSTPLYDLTATKEDQTLFVEVKYEEKSYSTGNIFWEIGERSWTQKYEKAGSGRIYITYVFPFEPAIYTTKASLIHTWDFSKYPLSSCKNPTYSVQGYLVPVDIIKQKLTRIAL